MGDVRDRLIIYYVSLTIVLFFLDRTKVKRWMWSMTGGLKYPSCKIPMSNIQWLHIYVRLDLYGMQKVRLTERSYITLWLTFTTLIIRSCAILWFSFVTIISIIQLLHVFLLSVSVAGAHESMKVHCQCHSPSRRTSPLFPWSLFWCFSLRRAGCHHGDIINRW